MVLIGATTGSDKETAGLPLPSGTEVPFIDWSDCKNINGHKSLLVNNNFAGSLVPVKFRVYQGSWHRVKSPTKDEMIPTHKARIDYDYAEYTVAAGAEASLPIYDDGYSEALRVTAEAQGGDGEASGKIIGPPPLETRNR